MGKSRRTWRFKAGLCLLAAFVALMLAEFVLRMTGVGFPRPYLADEFIGTRFQPGFRSWFSKEGGAWVEANSAGFRDTEHSLVKSQGELRIAVLGDSYVEAAQVDLAATFWKVIESDFNSGRSGNPARVMGFGISGFGTAQELLVFRHYVKPLQPDIVVLTMTLSNDIRNNSKELEPVQERPFFRLDDGQLEEDNTFRQHSAFLEAQGGGARFKTSLINCSHILQLAAEFKSHVGLPRNENSESAVEAGLESSVYHSPRTNAWKDAWELTEALIRRLHEEVRATGATLAVVTLTDGKQVHPDRSAYDKFCAQVGVEDLEYGDRRIAALCQEEGIAVLNLAQPMHDQAVADQAFYHGFRNTKFGEGHWNVAGHRVAGELIAEFLRELQDE